MIHFSIIDLSVFFHLGNSDHLDNSDHGPKNQISTICTINNKLAAFFPFHGLEGCRTLMFSLVFQIFQVTWSYLVFAVSLSPHSITEGTIDHQNCSVIPLSCAPDIQHTLWVTGPESKSLFQCLIRVYHRSHNFYLCLLARSSPFI